MRDLVPESQAYMDLLTFEQKLDSTVMRKRLEIQEVIRRPMKRKRKLRVFISHRFFTPEPEKVCSMAAPVYNAVNVLQLSCCLPPCLGRCCATMGASNQRKVT